MKKFLASVIVFVLCVSVALNVSADTSSSSGGNIKSDEEIINAVLEHFRKISAIPRQSGHEEKISRYLYEYAEGKGLKPVRDKSNNIVVDIPAIPGLEKLPMVALQGHMDMVCVSDRPDYDPEKDPIEVIRENDIIRANGTSLGADDGIGVAMILCVMDGLMPHGPVRAIITTGEESSMEGARALDPSHFDGCTYLVNLDGEESGSVILGCASGTDVKLTAPLETVKPAGDTSVTIRISGLQGGHSGLMINTYRLNAIKLMMTLLCILSNNGVSYEVASLRGGNATNAIPTSSECEIVMSGKDMDRLKTVIDKCKKAVMEIYKNVEPDVKIEYTENKELPEKVFSDRSFVKILYCKELMFNGVLEMENNSDNPDTSANLGIIEATPEGLTIESLMRSMTKENRDYWLEFQKKMAELNNFNFELNNSTPIWEYAEINPLRDLYCSSYQKHTGHLPKHMTVHGGLECGYFVQAAPGLHMISIGPDIIDAHSVKETCRLSGIVTVWRALADTLAHMDECAKASPEPAKPSASSDAA